MVGFPDANSTSAAQRLLRAICVCAHEDQTKSACFFGAENEFSDISTIFVDPRWPDGYPSLKNPRTSDRPRMASSLVSMVLTEVERDHGLCAVDHELRQELRKQYQSLSERGFPEQMILQMLRFYANGHAGAYVPSFSTEDMVDNNLTSAKLDLDVIRHVDNPAIEAQLNATTTAEFDAFFQSCESGQSFLAPFFPDAEGEQMEQDEGVDESHGTGQDLYREIMDAFEHNPPVTSTPTPTPRPLPDQSGMQTGLMQARRLNVIVDDQEYKAAALHQYFEDYDIDPTLVFPTGEKCMHWLQKRTRDKDAPYRNHVIKHMVIDEDLGDSCLNGREFIRRVRKLGEDYVDLKNCAITVVSVTVDYNNRTRCATKNDVHSLSPNDISFFDAGATSITQFERLVIEAMSRLETNALEVTPPNPNSFPDGMAHMVFMDGPDYEPGTPGQEVVQVANDGLLAAAIALQK